MQQPSDEIKSRLDIVDVLREYIPLKPAGINFRALCPFHREKTPSFLVSPEKQIWHCFGCEKGGDIFSFIMEIEGVSFVEALRILAPKAGVTLKRQDPKLTSQRNRLLDILEISARYYHKMLSEERGKEALGYLNKRGLNEATIDEWRLGYSPDSWDDLINLLKSKGFNDNEIFLAGMSIKREGAGRFYNRFRGRIMFPISDVNGNIVAFSARVSPEKEKEEKLGKYINSPQTMIYDKSRILFGLDKAKMAIKNEDLAIAVEGQMDVITAYEHNFKNVVAFSGTAISEEHIKLIKRYTNNIAFALDSDSAGQLAISRGDDFINSKRVKEEIAEDSWGNKKIYLDKGLSYEMNETIIEIPAGKDPDEFIKNNPKNWKTAVLNRKSLMQHYFNNILTGFNVDNIENKRLVTRKLLSKISKLGNKIEQDFWLKKLSQKIDVPENLLRESIEARSVVVQDKDSDNIGKNKIAQSRGEMLSELLLVLIIKFPDLLDYVAGNIYVDQLAGIANKIFYKNLIIYYNSIKDSKISRTKGEIKIDYNNFKNWLENFLAGEKENESSLKVNDNQDSQLKLFDKLVLLGDKDYYDLTGQQANLEINKIIAYLKKFYLVNRMKEIEKLITQSEEEADDGKLKELMEELKILSDEFREIKN